MPCADAGGIVGAVGIIAGAVGASISKNANGANDRRDVTLSYGPLVALANSVSVIRLPTFKRAPSTGRRGFSVKPRTDSCSRPR